MGKYCLICKQTLFCFALLFFLSSSGFGQIDTTGKNTAWVEDSTRQKAPKAEPAKQKGKAVTVNEIQLWFKSDGRLFSFPPQNNIAKSILVWQARPG